MAFLHLVTYPSSGIGTATCCCKVLDKLCICKDDIYFEVFENMWSNVRQDADRFSS